MNIPNKAIEAAAEALWGDFVQGEGEYPNFSDYAKKEQDYWRHDARVAIEAAMPAIHAAIKQRFDELEATGVVAVSPKRATSIVLEVAPTPPCCGYCAGSGWAPGCGDQTCCPPGPCASCDGTGTPKDRP